MNRIFQLFQKICSIFYSHSKFEKIQLLEDKQQDSTNVADETKGDISVVLKEFKDIVRGDIIYAKRIDKENPDKILPKGHEAGPFLVLENQGNKLLCAYGSSIKKQSQYVLMTDNQDYEGLSKKEHSYFYLNNMHEITIETYVRKMDTLNDSDQHILQKIINILAKKQEHFKKYRSNLGLELGDIFKHNKKQYFVYKIEDNMITAIRVSDIPNENKFQLQNRKSYIYFDDVIKIKNHEGYLPIDFVTKEFYDCIAVQFQEYIKETFDKKVQNGIIVQYENKDVYIDSMKEEYLGYPIYPYSKTDEYPIIVQQRKYSVDFGKCYQIPKNAFLEGVRSASKEETIHNRTIKNLYEKLVNEQLRQEQMKKTEKIVQRGSIVKHNNNFIYIYAQEGEQYLGYPIDPYAENDAFAIIVQQKKYASDFKNTYQLHKNDTFEVIMCAKEEEADYNRDIKKSYNKLLKSQLEVTKTKVLEKANIQEGVVVTEKTLMHTEHIVLSRTQNEVLTILLENGKMYCRYLDIRQVEFNRILTKEELKDLLIQLQENPSIYYGYMSEKRLHLILDKYLTT